LRIVVWAVKPLWSHFLATVVVLPMTVVRSPAHVGLIDRSVVVAVGQPEGHLAWSSA